MSSFFTFRLSEDFISSYRTRKAPFGYIDAGGNSVGEITFLRTYSRLKEDGTKKGHMFVFYIESKTKMEPDLENAKDGFEHTECEYFNKENLPQQENNEELMDLLKKILK